MGSTIGFPSTNPQIIHALIYSAILTMMVSQHIEQLLQNRRTRPATDEARQELFPLLRLATVLHAFSALLLHVVYQKARGKRNATGLTELILKETRDPNRTRDSLVKQLQNL